MKKQVLNQLESLIKKFNEKNVALTGDEYVMEKPTQYKRGCYSMNVKYRMVYSMDMLEIMDFVKQNNLLLRLGYYDYTQTPYMDFQ